MSYCKECNKEFLVKDKRQKFCSRSCSGKFNNSRRNVTDEQKQKISESLKKYYSEHPSPCKGWVHAQKVGNAMRRGRKPKSIFDVSSRTKSKILNRLKLSCCICNWNEDSIDIHHIIPKKYGGSNELENLTPLCPNHHRLADRGKLDKNLLIPLNEILPSNWNDNFYFG